MENKNINRIYDLWLEKATADPDLKKNCFQLRAKMKKFQTDFIAVLNLELQDYEALSAQALTE